MVSIAINVVWFSKSQEHALGTGPPWVALRDGALHSTSLHSTLSILTDARSIKLNLATFLVINLAANTKYNTNS